MLKEIETGSVTKIFDGDTLVESYVNIVKGDVTGDGKVELGDVTKTYRYFRNKIEMNEYYTDASDVTGDGVVGLGDVTKMYRYFRGKLTTLD